MKKVITVLMAFVMAISCATVISDSSSDVDAQSVEMDVGDAWGMGGTINVQTLIDMMNESGDLVMEDGEQITVETLYMMLEMVAGFAGIDLTIDDLDVSAEIWTLAEVTEKNDNGYVIDMEAVLSLKLEASLVANTNMETIIDGILDGLLDDDLKDLVGIDDDSYMEDEPVTIILDGLVANMYMNMDGTFHVDKSFGLGSAELGIGMGGIVKGSSNIMMTESGIEFAETASKMDDIIMDVEMDMSMTAIDEPIYLLPPGNDDEWEGEPKYHVLITGSMYTNLVDSTDNGVVYMEVNVDVPYEAQSYIGPDGTQTVNIDMDDSEDIVFNYPFDNNEVPEFLLIGDSLKLDASEVKTVKNAISVSKNPVKEVMDDVTLKVTLLDDDWEEWKVFDVKYGSTKELPDYTEVGEGYTFVGWSGIGFGTMWNDNTPITGHVELYPVISKVKDTMPTNDDFLQTGSVTWNITEGSTDLDKTIPQSVLGNGTLYVNVTDSMGNVLYSWELFTGYDDNLAGSQVKVGITEMNLPDTNYIKNCVGDDTALYLKFAASGIMPTTTHVSYYVGDVFADGSTVEMYYDDATGSKTVYQASLTVQDGTITMPLTHCSSYILVGDGTSGDDEGGIDMMTIAIIAVVILAVAVLAFVIIKKKNGTI